MEILQRVSSVLLNNDSLHIIGTKQVGDYKWGTVHLEISLYDIMWPIRWDVIRLIWIGFAKNQNNNKCHFGNVPKDIILLILKLLV